MTKLVFIFLYITMGDDKVKLAFDLWRLVSQWFFVNEAYQKTNDDLLWVKLRDIEVKMGDIVDEFIELEDLIPAPITYK